jgi:hypothetical protein
VNEESKSFERFITMYRPWKTRQDFNQGNKVMRFALYKDNYGLQYEKRTSNEVGQHQVSGLSASSR